MEFIQIPKDLIRVILGQLDIVNLIRICTLSKYFNEIIRTSVWPQAVNIHHILPHTSSMILPAYDLTIILEDEDNDNKKNKAKTIEKINTIMKNYSFNYSSFYRGECEAEEDEVSETFLGLTYKICTLGQNVSYLAKCQKVMLQTCFISGKELALLAKCRTVKLFECDGFGDDDIEHLKNVKEVFLSECRRLTSKCFKYLSKCSTVRLDINNKIDAEDMKYLSNVNNISLFYWVNIDDHAKYLANCQEVTLFHCPITAKGLVSLANCDAVNINGCFYINNIHYFLPLANCRKVIWNSTDISEEITKLKKLQKG